MERRERDGGMTAVYSHCSRFTRRHDMNVFNMGDYQSCENCTHFSDEGNCIVQSQKKPAVGPQSFE